jgi:hypothetical protein
MFAIIIVRDRGWGLEGLGQMSQVSFKASSVRWACVTRVRHQGTMHAFAMLNALAATPACRNAVEMATEHLRAL